MPRRLTLTAEAIDDIDAMWRWLQQPGAGRTALRRGKAIVAAINSLTASPYLHPRGDVAGTRKLTVRGYVAIYKVEPDTGDTRTAGDILVVSVFGPGQQQSR